MLINEIVPVHSSMPVIVFKFLVLEVCYMDFCMNVGYLYCVLQVCSVSRRFSLHLRGLLSCPIFEKLNCSIFNDVLSY